MREARGCAASSLRGDGLDVQTGRVKGCAQANGETAYLTSAEGVPELGTVVPVLGTVE